MSTMAIPAISYDIPIQSSYPGLDANGNNSGDVACLNDPNCDMNQRLLDLLRQDITGTGAGYIPSGASLVDSSSYLFGIPNWAWAGIAVIGGIFFLRDVR